MPFLGKGLLFAQAIDPNVAFDQLLWVRPTLLLHPHPIPRMLVVVVCRLTLSPARSPTMLTTSTPSFMHSIQIHPRRQTTPCRQPPTIPSTQCDHHPVSLLPHHASCLVRIDYLLPVHAVPRSALTPFLPLLTPITHHLLDSSDDGDSQTVIAMINLLHPEWYPPTAAHTSPHVLSLVMFTAGPLTSLSPGRLDTWDTTLYLSLTPRPALLPPLPH